MRNHRPDHLHGGRGRRHRHRLALLIEITTLLLLRLSPMVRLTRATFFSFALMLGVFAVWALSATIR
jgi:hypothetical protein